MKKQFVTYEIALKLKELGFDEECLAKYCRYNPNDEIKLFPHTQDFFKGYFYSCNNSDYGKEKIATPLWQQAIDWFWINYKILIVPYLVPDKTETIMWLVKSKVEDYYHNREQAILKAIELCQKK